MQRSPLYVVFLGPPGVGKGAQAALLAAREKLAHLSTGEVLREEITRASDLGRRIADAVKRGEFVDDATVLEIVRGKLQAPECAAGCVMDGFPRTLDQAHGLDRFLGSRGERIRHALLIEAPEATILERLSGRRVCKSCGQTFHVLFKVPRHVGLCDRCGGPLVRRPDDDVAVHRERLRTYREKTRPLIDYYKGTGALREVSGGGTIEAIGARVLDALRARERA